MSLLMLLFVILLAESSRSYQLSRSYRYRSPSHHQHFATENEEYYLTNGHETLITTLSSLRPLFPTELELTFDHLQSLKKLAQAQQWPPKESTSTSRESIERALAWSEQSHTEEDVKNVLGKFRKTILGLEKYRINNPGRVATLYCEMLKTCLAVPDCWGAAANALEYAGLVFRDHVIERLRSDTLTEISHPVLDVSSLWTTACMRLLDIDLTQATKSLGDSAQTNNTNSNRPMDDKSVTWDQKFFSQIEMNDESREAIQDMMLCIVRVAVRLLLAREADLASASPSPSPSSSVDTASNGPLGMVDVMVDEYRSDGQGFLPPASSVKLVLALDFKLLQETGIGEEEEANESLIQHLTGKDDAFVDYDEINLLRCCDRRCTAYPELQSQDVFRDFIDAGEYAYDESE